jgi:hypothetical protein
MVQWHLAPIAWGILCSNRRRIQGHRLAAGRQRGAEIRGGDGTPESMAPMLAAKMCETDRSKRWLLQNFDARWMDIGGSRFKMCIYTQHLHVLAYALYL